MRIAPERHLTAVNRLNRTNRAGRRAMAVLNTCRHLALVTLVRRLWPRRFKGLFIIIVATVLAAFALPRQHLSWLDAVALALAVELGAFTWLMFWSPTARALQLEAYWHCQEIEQRNLTLAGTRFAVTGYNANLVLEQPRRETVFQTRYPAATIGRPIIEVSLPHGTERLIITGPYTVIERPGRMEISFPHARYSSKGALALNHELGVVIYRAPSSILG